MKKLFMILALVFAILPSYAQVGDKMMLRQWTRDLKTLQNEVLTPLNEEMQNRPCVEDYGIYYQAYINKLKELRSKINPLSYLLLRDGIIASYQAMGQFIMRIDCKEISQWEFFKVHLDSQIDFIGDILAIIDVANAN